MNEMGGSMQSTGAIDAVRIGSKWVGDRYPCYIIAEIGINHNGDIDQIGRASCRERV